MEKKEKVSVWKFNDDEWKIHITSESLKDNVQEKFNLGKTSTIYYENGSFQEERPAEEADGCGAAVEAWQASSYLL
jgi:hypothetical protein